MKEIVYDPDNALSPIRQDRPSGRTSPFPAVTPVGMGYVPFQQWDKVYSPEMGFERGTIFAALDKPYVGEAVCK